MTFVVRKRRGISLSAGFLMLLVACAAPEREEPKVETGADTRERLVMEARERDKVLAEMRAMLEAIDGILQGLTQKDPAAVAERARSGGMAIAADIDPNIRKQLPENFVDLGMRTHKAFDELARVTEAGATEEAILSHLASITGNCVGCHAAYRIDEAR